MRREGAHVLPYRPFLAGGAGAGDSPGARDRGTDYVKIVTGAQTVEEEVENLRITHLLCEHLAVPFLFLSGGRCQLHRRIGPMLGCSMYLCVYEHDELSTRAQPVLEHIKAVRDHFEFF